MSDSNYANRRLLANGSARAEAPPEVVTRHEYSGAGCPQTGAIISRSVYFYDSKGEFIRVRHYGPRPRRGRWRVAVLRLRLLASRARRRAGATIRGLAGKVGL